MQAVVYLQPFYALLADIFPAALLRGAPRVFVVSHELPLDEAPSAYQEFDQGMDGYTKVILKPDVG